MINQKTNRRDAMGFHKNMGGFYRLPVLFYEIFVIESHQYLLDM